MSKKPEPKIKKSLISIDFYKAQITLVVGDSGSGKSFFCQNHPDSSQSIYFDCENRYEQQLEVHPEIKLTKFDKLTTEILLGKYIEMLVYDNKTFDIDNIKTFNELEVYLGKAFKAKPAMICLDGISDIRRMATDKWETENKKTAFGLQAWGDINNLVKRILYRLFNFARLYKIKVLVTCFFEEVYTKDGQVTGEHKIGVKDYIISRVDEVVALQRKGTKFTIKRGKSPRGPTESADWTLGYDGVEDNND